MPEFVITVARGFGSGGRTIGKMLAQRLDVDYYDGELLQLASEESGINIELFGRADEKAKGNLFRRYNRSYGEWVIPPNSDSFVSDDNLFNYQAKIIRDLAEKKNCVIIGRCSDYILRNHPGVIRLFVYADEQTCIKTVSDLYGLTAKQAEERGQHTAPRADTYTRLGKGGQNTYNDVTVYFCIKSA